MYHNKVIQELFEVFVLYPLIFFEKYRNRFPENNNQPLLSGRRTKCHGLRGVECTGEEDVAIDYYGIRSSQCTNGAVEMIVMKNQ